MRLGDVFAFFLIIACIGLLMVVSYAAGTQDARQRYAPMACEARCEVTYRDGKVIKTVCPDSLGRMNP